MVWGEVYAKTAKEIDKGKIVAITGKLDKREDSVRIVANEIGPMSGRKAGQGSDDRYPYGKGR